MGRKGDGLDGSSLEGSSMAFVLPTRCTMPNSSSVNGAVDMGMEGGGQSGIHSGRVKALGVAE